MSNTSIINLDRIPGRSATKLSVIVLNKGKILIILSKRKIRNITIESAPGIIFANAKRSMAKATSSKSNQFQPPLKNCQLWANIHRQISITNKYKIIRSSPTKVEAIDSERF